VDTGGRNHGDSPSVLPTATVLVSLVFSQVLVSGFAPLQGAGLGKTETQFEKQKKKLPPLGSRIHGAPAWCRFLFDHLRGSEEVRWAGGLCSIS